MSTEVLEFTSSVPDVRTSNPDTVVRRAFYLTADGRTLFSWLHTHRDANHWNHGVVICAPIGFEQLHSHCALRHLADRLADQQIPTIRFDWHGTGDSAGDDLDSDRLAVWKSDIRAAVRWMKNELGCQRVSVVGLRLGATIAALSLDDEPVDNLVLWAPVTNGRAFVREMTVIDLTAEVPRVPGGDSSAPIEAAGFWLSRETATELSKSSLMQSGPACERILLATRDDVPGDPRIAERFASVNIPTDVLSLPGTAEMLLEPHKGKVPDIAIESITSWLHGRICETGSRSLERIRSVSPPIETPPTACGFESKNLREEAVVLSDSPNLFGVLCEPAETASGNRPLIILLNSGAASRVGPGRMNVELARHLAAQGFRCLRMDFCGIGDSVSTVTEDENHSYVRTMFRDIELTLQFVKSHWGVKKCVLMGLCSGAYASFQSAVQMADPVLVEGVMINPLTYYWQDGMPLEFAPSKKMIEQHYYWQSALRPEKWLKLIRGKSSIGLAGAFRVLGSRFRLPKLFRRLEPKSCSAGCKPYVTHPEKQDLDADLKQLEKNGRHVTMFFASDDPGYSILMIEAGRRAKSMIRRGQIEVSFIDNADHTFSRHWARQVLFDKISQHLERRYR